MKKYETVIRIVTEGSDEFDAGEKAGEFIDLTKMVEDENILISCEPTRAIDFEEDIFAPGNGVDKPLYVTKQEEILGF